MNFNGILENTHLVKRSYKGPMIGEKQRVNGTSALYSVTDYKDAYGPDTPALPVRPPWGGRMDGMMSSWNDSYYYTVEHPLRVKPFERGIETFLTTNLPVWVVSTSGSSSKNDDGSFTTLSIASVNFFCEEGANLAASAQKVISESTQIDLMRRYNQRTRLYPRSVEDFLEKIHFYGVIKNTATKREVSSRLRCSQDILCTVAGYANIANYWGDVKPGDHIGFVISKKRNRYTHVILPNGDRGASTRNSPESYFRMEARNFTRDGGDNSHMSNLQDVGNPRESDFDFVDTVSVRQSDMLVDFSTGMITEKKTEDVLTYQKYNQSMSLRIGIVQDNPGRLPSDEELKEAHRNDVAAGKLPTIRISLFPR